MTHITPPAPDASNPDDLLSESDTGLARVLEDLVDVLITRGTIQFTKLLERRQTRANRSQRLKLLPDEDSNDLF